MPNPTAISLFAGAGGCSLGFQQANFDILLAVEKDKDAASTYRANFPLTPCLQADITEVTSGQILAEANLKPDELTFLIGGPPCQGFSSAGTRFLDDPRNKLVKRYVELLNDIRPEWFFMENVEGLLTAGKGEYFPKLVQSFLNIGYSIQVHKIYCHWYGLPQKRKRVFIIGNVSNHNFAMPSFTHFEASGLFDKNPVLSVLDAISDLPTPGSNQNAVLQYLQEPLNLYQKAMRSVSITDHWSLPLELGVSEKVRLLKQGQTMKHLPAHLQHPSFQRRANRRVIDGVPTEQRGGAPLGLKRLLSNEPCLTITSAASREFIHPLEDRFLTIRECARIQSFPDRFKFSGTAQSKIRQIGNAIPPLISRMIATHLIQQRAPEAGTRVQVGQLLSFTLTKANAMSPVLEKVNDSLKAIQTSDRQTNSAEKERARHAFASATFPTQ